MTECHLHATQHAAIRANILQDIHKQYIMWQSLKALKYMHSAELLHRDMKPSNLLLNSDCLMKVADFGLARSLREGDIAEGTETVLTDYVATRWCALTSPSPPTSDGHEVAWRVPAAPTYTVAYPFRRRFGPFARPGTSLRYRAPEILLGSTKYSFAVDMWSMGCILAEMLQGKPMFPGSSTINQIEKIVELAGHPSAEVIKGM